ncbi:MAG: lysophospholipid acyltransferase family protein [Verrucomicrobiota bacterium]
MIRAEKDPFWEHVLYYFFRWLIRKNFYAVYIDGAEHLRELSRIKPVIGIANHTNWWDGVVLLLMTRIQRKKEFYCMMEEKQMKHYPFFRYLGAFSVNLESAVRSAAAVKYALNLLHQAKTLIWIFPQGEMVKATDPIKVRPGVDFLAKKSPNAMVLPAAFRYQFWREQKPCMYIRIGEPYSALENSDEKMEQTLIRLTEELDADLKSDAAQQYEHLLTPALSINKYWELFFRFVRGRWLGFKSTN